jgi:uncharacterized protein
VELAFWDSSALAPLCVVQPSSLTVRELTERYGMVVWWSTPVEMRSAFARLLRTGQLDANQHAVAREMLHRLRHTWRELQPTETLREQAEMLIERFPLKAADALQLAAALAWCAGKPDGRVLISGDVQLLQAAQQLGFVGVEA